METRISYRPLAYAALLATTLALGACGGSSTTIVERDPTEVDDDHGHDDPDHQDEPQHSGRLLVSESNEQRLYMYDLKQEEILAELDLQGSALTTALYASPSSRYGIVVRGGDAGEVNFVDSGLFWEEHGDHHDLRTHDPRLMDKAIHGDRPAHVTYMDDQIAIFFDGNAGAPARVHVLSEQNIEADEPALELEYSVNQHGAAQVRGDYLLSTVRDPQQNPDSTLPTRVALYHRHGDHYDSEGEFNVDCPGLHGSAQNERFVAFGCNDGVLVIEEDDQNHFEARKISFKTRISKVLGHQDLDQFVGVGSGVLYAVNPAAESGRITPIHWTDDADLTPVGFAFVEHGEHLIVLDDQGGVTMLETHEWEVVNDRVQVTASGSAPESNGYEIAGSGSGQFVYVSDPTAGEIKTVDIETLAVVDTLALDFVPHKLVWLGTPVIDEHEDHAH